MLWRRTGSHSSRTCGRPELEQEAAPSASRRYGDSGASGSALSVRFLQPEDLPALMALEKTVWEPHQAANAETLSARISTHPGLSIGAFCASSGRALASLFARPVHVSALRSASTWHECVTAPQVESRPRPRALFGISLSSVEPRAGQAIFDFFWPHALKSGWREMYLGSPVPGLRAWLARHPGRTIDEYVHARSNGLPRDPQLRYYHRKGFRQVVAIREGYFPHADSLDHGVIVGGRIPLSALSALWRLVPLSWLCGMRKWLFILR